MRRGVDAVHEEAQMNETLTVHSSPFDILNRCIHCGMCLPVCPTYALTANETSSPRGRIRLMKAVAEDKLPVTNQFVDEMYFCLDCQACETVCPAGVHYGALVEDARRTIAASGRDPFTLRFLKLLLLKIVLPSKRMLKLTARLFWFYQRSGLREAVERSALLSVISDRLHERHALLPRVSVRGFDEDIVEVQDRLDGSPQRGNVAFLTGCIMNYTLPQVHRDAVDVLRACGYKVIIPSRQVCCGSLHAHNGEQEDAMKLARKNLDVFDRYEFDVLIVDSAGCGAFLKEYGRLLQDDPLYAERAVRFSEKVKDITEILRLENLPKLAGTGERVTYHEACHLVHTQKISEEPRRLINAIPGVEFVELPEATWCCGSAGMYNAVRFDDSMELLERKMANVESTTANVVLTANPGCHLQLEYGIRKRGLGIEVLHPVSLLKRALMAKVHFE